MDIISTGGNGANDEPLTDDDVDFMRQSNGQRLDAKQIAKVREILAKDPNAWTMLGDLCAQIRYHAVGYLSKNPAAHESVRNGIQRMRESLCSEGSSQLEQLLVEQILTCWVQCSVVGHKLEMDTRGVHQIDHGSYWERRYNSAQGRLVRSIEALARIRKLKLPNVQLNLADKQVNISGSTG